MYKLSVSGKKIILVNALYFGELEICVLFLLSTNLTHSYQPCSLAAVRQMLHLLVEINRKEAGACPGGAPSLVTEVSKALGNWINDKAKE